MATERPEGPTISTDIAWTRGAHTRKRVAPAIGVAPRRAPRSAMVQKREHVLDRVEVDADQLRPVVDGELELREGFFETERLEQDSELVLVLRCEGRFPHLLEVALQVRRRRPGVPDIGERLHRLVVALAERARLELL